MGLSCEIGAVWQRWRKQARVFGDVLSVLRQKKNPFLMVLAPNHSVTCNTQSLTPGRWNKARGCHKISHQSGLSLPRKDALGSPYGTASSPPTSPHTAGPTPEAAWGYLGREGRKKKKSSAETCSSLCPPAGSGHKQQGTESRCYLFAASSARSFSTYRAAANPNVFFTRGSKFLTFVPKGGCKPSVVA